MRKFLLHIVIIFSAASPAFSYEPVCNNKNGPFVDFITNPTVFSTVINIPVAGFTYYLTDPVYSPRSAGGVSGFSVDVVSPYQNNQICSGNITQVIKNQDIYSQVVNNKASFPTLYAAFVSDLTSTCAYSLNGNCYSAPTATQYDAGAIVYGSTANLCMGTYPTISIDNQRCPANGAINYQSCNITSTTTTTWSPSRNRWVTSTLYGQTVAYNCFADSTPLISPASQSQISAKIGGVGINEISNLQRLMLTQSTFVNSTLKTDSNLFGAPFSNSLVPQGFSNYSSGRGMKVGFGKDTFQSSVAYLASDSRLEKAFKERFPFSVFSKLYTWLDTFLVKDPTPPVFEIVIGEWRLTQIDFSPYDSLAAFVRWMSGFYLCSVAYLSVRSRLLGINPKG